MGSIKVDIAIIGAGPGGYVAAICAGKEGKSVAIIEKDKVGGTCTNYGCIPTKAMLSSINVMEEIENSKRIGLTIGDAKLNYEGIVKHRSRAVTTSRKGIELLLQKANVKLISGEAVIEKDKKLEVFNKDKTEKIAEIFYDKLIIATGSAPVKFSPFNIPEVWTSDDIWNIEKLPTSLGIIGGGVIGCEFATFFSKIGVKITIIELMPQLIPTEDEDISKELTDSFKKNKDLTIICSTKVKECIKNDSGFLVKAEMSDGTTKEFTFENILLSVGRRPILPEGFDKIGVELNEKGFIKIDDYMKTKNPDVYAIGDVTGKLMLAHSASKMGEVAVSNILGGSEKVNYSSIPSVIFTIPEIATTGLREKDCIKLGIKYKVGICPFIANGKARAMGISKGFVKVITDTQTHQILGVSIIGSHATDMVMEGVIAVENKMKVEELFKSVHPHPTLTETLIEAALASIDKAIHL